MPRNPDPREAEIAALRAELAAAKAAANAATVKKLTFKRSEKGAVSVYGLGRFPVTLYRSQWESITSPEALDALRQFIQANAATLATRD